jgi:hypothetical protein
MWCNSRGYRIAAGSGAVARVRRSRPPPWPRGFAHDVHCRRSGPAEPGRSPGRSPAASGWRSSPCPCLAAPRSPCSTWRSAARRGASPRRPRWHTRPSAAAARPTGCYTGRGGEGAPSARYTSTSTAPTTRREKDGAPNGGEGGRSAAKVGRAQRTREAPARSRRCRCA